MIVFTYCYAQDVCLRFEFRFGMICDAFRHRIVCSVLFAALWDCKHACLCTASKVYVGVRFTSFSEVNVFVGAAGGSQYMALNVSRNTFTLDQERNKKDTFARDAMRANREPILFAAL